MTGEPRAVRLSPQTVKVLTELPGYAKETVRDVPDTAVYGCREPASAT